MESFLIRPEDVEIVRAIHQNRSLRESAKTLGIDPSALVRKIQAFPTQEPLLQKINGKWRATAKGLQSISWLEESILSQRKKLDEKYRFRISTTAWMAEQALIPELPTLSKLSKKSGDWTILTTATSFEDELLRGSAEFVVACHAPFDPGIAHRKIGPEKWVVVIPAIWQKEFKKQTNTEAFLLKKPYIRHLGIHPSSGLPFCQNLPPSDFITDSLIGVRAFLEAGIGWSCVPYLLVKSLLQQKVLVALDLETHFSGDICLWWLRSRTELHPIVKKLTAWLEKNRHQEAI